MIRAVHQPGEVTHVDLGFVADIGTPPVAIEARARVVELTALAATALTLATRATLILTGGTDGESYLVTTTLPLATGATHEIEVEVACVDGRWAMPGGGAAMLTIAEFVDAVGLDETIRLTDATGVGRIDAAILTGALVAAQGQAEAAIGGRYRLPLVQVPQALKTAIADLARLRLYPGDAPDGVKTSAATAARYFDRLASGTVQLPTGAAEIETVSSDPVLVRPGSTAYPDGLLGYGFG